MDNSLGDRIKSARIERGLTQRQLAALTDLDYTYLSKIEKGRLEHTPSIRALQELSRALEIDELELMSLAQKVPQAFSGIASNHEAVRFFRRASNSITSDAGWRDLNAFLDRLEGNEGRRT